MMERVHRLTSTWRWCCRVFPRRRRVLHRHQRDGHEPRLSGQWAQEATFHDWPGQVDYLLRDDFISQTTRKAYGLQDLPDFLSGKSDVEVTAEVSDRLYVVGYPYLVSKTTPRQGRLFTPRLSP